jgi:hypothetical protein
MKSMQMAIKAAAAIMGNITSNILFQGQLSHTGKKSLEIINKDLNVTATLVIECANSSSRTKPRGSLQVYKCFAEHCRCHLHGSQSYTQQFTPKANV